jgi:hypothetical protein
MHMGTHEKRDRREGLAGELAILSYSLDHLSDRELDRLLTADISRREKPWVLRAAKRIVKRLSVRPDS